MTTPITPARGHVRRKLRLPLATRILAWAFLAVVLGGVGYWAYDLVMRGTWLAGAATVAIAALVAWRAQRRPPSTGD